MPCTDDLTMAILRALIETDTSNPPGNELAAVNCLKTFLEREGLSCEIQDLGEDRANLICVIGSGKPVLEFCGHLDTVPAAGKWLHEKFRVTEEDGKLYGRGTCDMKGAVAAMTSAAIALAPELRNHSRALRLCFVADEEQYSIGMHAFQEAYAPADVAVLGEPTSLRVAVAHRGRAVWELVLHGTPHHAALPSDEESAVTLAARAIQAIDGVNDALRAQCHPILPPPSVCVTGVHGFVKDNVVPPEVSLFIDLRPFPGVSEEEATSLLENALYTCGVSRYTLKKRVFVSGAETDPQDAFARLCLREVSAITGRTETPTCFRATCEQVFMNEKGTRTVILGPGSLDQAHSPDEFVEKDQLLKATAIYGRIIRSTLMDSGMDL